MRRLNAVAARKFAFDVFRRHGLSEEHAGWVADALVDTSLMGIDTHGLRLMPLYVRELVEGRSKTQPFFSITFPRDALARMDAGDALGIVAGRRAAVIAVELARACGIGIVSVCNSNHFGAASIYGRAIARSGMIGIVMTSAAARTAPFNGAAPVFGTNPICFVAPADADDYFSLDMATSQISYSRIKALKSAGLPIPTTWAVDRSGAFAECAERVSALAPLGGYKGQGLAMMVEVLCGILGDMPMDHELEHFDTGPFDRGRRIAHFLLAIDIGCCVDLVRFRKRLTALVSAVRSVSAKPHQKILVPGDPERVAWLERSRLGIPVTEDEYAALTALAEGLDVRMDGLFHGISAAAAV